MISKRFMFCLTDKERLPSFNLLKRINFPLFISRFSELSGVKFSERIMGVQKGAAVKLRRKDIVALSSK
jgi:hypothetical protein